MLCIERGKLLYVKFILLSSVCENKVSKFFNQLERDDANLGAKKRFNPAGPE